MLKQRAEVTILTFLCSGYTYNLFCYCPNAKKSCFLRTVQVGKKRTTTHPHNATESNFRNFHCDLTEPAFTTQQCIAGEKKKKDWKHFRFFLERSSRLMPSLGALRRVDWGSYKRLGNSQNVWCLSTLKAKSRPGK